MTLVLWALQKCLFSWSNAVLDILKFDSDWLDAGNSTFSMLEYKSVLFQCHPDARNAARVSVSYCGPGLQVIMSIVYMKYVHYLHQCRSGLCKVWSVPECEQVLMLRGKCLVWKREEQWKEHAHTYTELCLSLLCTPLIYYSAHTVLPA